MISFLNEGLKIRQKIILMLSQHAKKLAEKNKKTKTLKNLYWDLHMFSKVTHNNFLHISQKFDPWKHAQYKLKEYFSAKWPTKKDFFCSKVTFQEALWFKNNGNPWDEKSHAWESSLGVDTVFMRWMLFQTNPFLFSCPSCIQASLSPNCLKLTIPGFPHNCLPVSCGDIGFKTKILGLVLAWKSGPKVPFLPLGRSCSLQTFLLSDLVGRVWQPSADSNGLLAHHFIQQGAVTLDPEILNSNKKGAKLPFLSAEGCHSHTLLEGRHCPLITYQGDFFKGVETLCWYK